MNYIWLFGKGGENLLFAGPLVIACSRSGRYQFVRLGDTYESTTHDYADAESYAYGEKGQAEVQAIEKATAICAGEAPD